MMRIKHGQRMIGILIGDKDIATLGSDAFSKLSHKTMKNARRIIDAKN
jgi:hypothetical protein